MFMENRKAQLTIVGLVLVFIMIIVVANFMPIISEQIDLSINNTPTMSTSTQGFLHLIPMFLVLSIIITLFIFAVPYRPTG